MFVESPHNADVEKLDKGIAKVVKSLGISYAEACVRFSLLRNFAKKWVDWIRVQEAEGYPCHHWDRCGRGERGSGIRRKLYIRCHAVLTHPQAYWESAAAAEERERAKKEERALKRWTKLINGLRVRARLQAEYGTGERVSPQPWHISRIF